MQTILEHVPNVVKKFVYGVNAVKHFNEREVNIMNSETSYCDKCNTYFHIDSIRECYKCGTRFCKDCAKGNMYSHDIVKHDSFKPFKVDICEECHNKSK